MFIIICAKKIYFITLQIRLIQCLKGFRHNQFKVVLEIKTFTIIQCSITKLF